MKAIGNFIYKVYFVIVFIPLQVLFTIISALLCIILFPLIGPDRVSHHIGLFWGRSIVYSSLTPVKVYGREKLDPSKSYILIANHASSFDIYTIFGWIGYNIRWVMKKELTKIPLFGWATRASGQIAVDRSNSQAAIDSINAARETLKPGVSIMFFPEGTRSRDGKLKVFKKGAYHFAFDMRLDLVPITIKGAYKVKTPGKFLGSKGKIEIFIHDPVKIDSHDRNEMNKLIDKTREIIAAPLDE
ncbi:lysophospholipid acyltransferase family protein [Saccharicrinis sp. FJH54]|uniref:lysophospholipid acyltransferase family protein n=1 Tax=Saccharicrinis sp. FJH54 TaxID=3344665 RepID=UPI0035D4F0B8